MNRRNIIPLRILGDTRWDVGLPSTQNEDSRCSIVVKNGVTLTGQRTIIWVISPRWHYLYDKAEMKQKASDG